MVAEITGNEPGADGGAGSPAKGGGATRTDSISDGGGGNGNTAAESTNFSSQAKQDQLAELGLISSTTVKVIYYVVLVPFISHQRILYHIIPQGLPYPPTHPPALFFHFNIS